MNFNLNQIIEELCFNFGEGYPEKNEENFDGEWFNLTYYDFTFKVNLSVASYGASLCKFK